MLLTQYDYIITGTGCAGLSLAMQLSHAGKFANKKILLIDEATKNTNDRTWCFWEKDASLFEPVVHRQWDKLWFYGDDFQKELSIAPFRYKMIRGIDFYEYCFSQLKTEANFQFFQGKVETLFSEEKTGVVVNGQTVYADYVFNSILAQKPALKKNQQWLLQHFKGWQLKTAAPAFNQSAATLMDFRTEQEHGTSFCYVLPDAGNEALVEYTLFTPSLLNEEEYNKGLKRYVEEVLNIRDYQITGTEFGVIPMTNYIFPASQNNIINIGTAGGQTKGSSGYTFYFIQKHSKAIVESLVRTGKPFVKKTPSRFHFYDSVLLHILQNNSLPGKEIFSTLFQKNKASDVLKFLNNESSPRQELKIISSLPTMPFLKAAMKQIF